MLTIWRKTLIAVICVIILTTIVKVSFSPPNRNVLWGIVNQCISHESSESQPIPCAEVNVAKGYVVLKDNHGPLQYLLIPTEKVTGIESPVLLHPQQPNYFVLAWQKRLWVSQQYGKPVPDQMLSLIVNSISDRTQDQLHIHISCTKPQVISHFEALYPSLNTDWQPVHNGINHQEYWARLLTQQTLENTSPFILLDKTMPDGGANPGAYGLALLPAPNGDFILLATRHQWWKPYQASIEDIQDHHCSQLYPTQSKPRNSPGNEP